MGTSRGNPGAACTRTSKNRTGKLVGLGRLELPTRGLGNRGSVHLSYRPACPDSLNAHEPAYAISPALNNLGSKAEIVRAEQPVSALRAAYPAVMIHLAIHDVGDVAASREELHHFVTGAGELGPARLRLGVLLEAADF